MSRVSHHCSFLLTLAFKTKTCVMTLLVPAWSKLSPNLIEILAPYRLPMETWSGLGASTIWVIAKVFRLPNRCSWKHLGWATTHCWAPHLRDVTCVRIVTWISFSWTLIGAVECFFTIEWIGWNSMHRRLNGANLKGGLPAAIGNLSNLVSL